MAELGHTYDADIYFECWYKKLADTSWTDAGDLKGTATNRVATLFFPVDASSNKPVSETIQLKFVAKTNDTTKTPILLSYDIRGIACFPKRRVINLVVRCADNIKDKQGGDLGLSADDISTILYEADNASWPVTFYDLWGNTKYVKFLSMTGQVISKEKDIEPEEHYAIRLEEVALS